MGKIQVLDKSVSNKIAAGEVVERPASVVKELLENALDAGATHIVTEIKNGGISYIRVTDNGSGIAKEDVPTALLRHATSKISKAEDLDGILSLGFRGEALSSIGAVSKLEIYTRTADEETGTHLMADGGEVIECAEAGCPMGTTIVVRDLFMNTPARMKFLRKNYTEAGYVSDIVNRLALARADVSFRLLIDGKETLFTAGDSDLLQAIFAVYGKDLKNTMRPADYEENGVCAKGYCATGAGARPNRSMQNFFVNGRYIKSPLLARAVEEAYKNEVMGGKFPACVLLITLPPTMVDINVHPTKLEAKFADEKAVYHAVYWAAKNALYQKQEIPAVTLAAEEEEVIPIHPVTRPAVSNFGSRPAVKAPVMQEFTTPAPKKPANPFAWQGEAPKKTIEQAKPIYTEAVKPVEETKVVAKPVEETKKAEPAPAVVNEEPKEVTVFDVAAMDDAPKTEAEETPAIKQEDYRICGTIFDTYIIVEKAGQMLLVDQHAAHERIRYEALLKEFLGRRVQSQMLLLPVTVRLTSTEDSLFTEHRQVLEAMGFEAEPFGEKTVILRGAPESLDEESLRALFLEVLGNLGDGKRDARGEKTERALYTIACKSAVKAGNKLKDEEIKTLLDQVFSLEAINTCPHGRPITVAMTRGFIEKQFKRIV